MNNNKIIAETKSRQAEAGDPGPRGTRGYEDPASMTQILFFPLCRSREALRSEVTGDRVSEGAILKM